MALPRDAQKSSGQKTLPADLGQDTPIEKQQQFESPPKQATVILSTVYVYDGRVCIGCINETSDRVEAYTASGTYIAAFQNRKAAARAIGHLAGEVRHG